jgi:cytochrome c oxidase subunit 3
MASGEPNHDYHLVEPSPWPIVGSFAAFLLTFGAVAWFHGDVFGNFGGNGSIMLIGAMLVAFTMFVWWRDVIREGEYEGHHTKIVQIGLRYGMVLFIVSEVMFFVAWFWAYFNAAFFPTDFGLSGWPPEGIETFDPWHIPLYNTLILLTSGTTVTWAHHSLQHGDRRGLVQGLWCTVLLGALFTTLQVYEYAHAAFSFSGGIYGATFYMATGFHGFHVIVGTIFLAVCLFRAHAGHFKKDHHFGFEAAAWYWHFVDVVWLFLFSCIYVWGSGTPAVH